MHLKDVQAAVESRDLGRIKAQLRELDRQRNLSSDMRDVARHLARAFRSLATAINDPSQLKPAISKPPREALQSPKVQENIRAVALLTHRDLLKRNGAHWTLTTRKFSDIFGVLCPRESFVDFPVSTPATAFLVREDLVVTLHHNMASPPYSDIEALRVTFDFELQDPVRPESCKVDFLPEEIYQVTARYSLVEDSPHAFVALRLSRPVSGRRPVTCNFGVPISAREHVYMIGHPCGLPKFNNFDAVVMDASSADGFTASLDAFAGNSGSPVFNSNTHDVEGILAEGGIDFRTGDDGNGGSCYFTNVHEATALYPYAVRGIQRLQRLIGP